MITIKFENNLMADCFSDYLAMEISKEIIEKHKGQTLTYSISSYIMVLAFRNHVKNGLISYKDIQFEYENKIIHIDKNAKLYTTRDDGKTTVSLPKGFADQFPTLLGNLI